MTDVAAEVELVDTHPGEKQHGEACIEIERYSWNRNHRICY